MTFIPRFAALVLFLAPVALLANSISSVSSLTVFGDSLSDNGNAAIALGGTLPGNYAPNAFTDGPSTSPAIPPGGPYGLWIDQFAAKLGVADPTPFLAGGSNYAVASALSGHNALFSPVPPLTQVPYTADQVQLFGLAHGGAASASSLYTIWSGANDLAAGVSPITAADNEFANIKALATAGGKQFLWLNLPPLGATPDAVLKGPAAVGALNAASALYNFEWALDIAKLQALGIDVIGVDVNTLFVNLAADPGTFGFTNITDPAQNTSGNPNTFLYWDGEHPTTAADALVANLALADYVAAPEPASVAFSALGMVSLLLLGTRFGGGLRRRAAAESQSAQ
jgi:outer membrane lipase/esterase